MRNEEILDDVYGISECYFPKNKRKLLLKINPLAKRNIEKLYIDIPEDKRGEYVVEIKFGFVQRISKGRIVQLKLVKRNDFLKIFKDEEELFNFTMNFKSAYFLGLRADKKYSLSYSIQQEKMHLSDFVDGNEDCVDSLINDDEIVEKTINFLNKNIIAVFFSFVGVVIFWFFYPIKFSGIFYLLRENIIFISSTTLAVLCCHMVAFDFKRNREKINLMFYKLMRYVLLIFPLALFLYLILMSISIPVFAGDSYKECKEFLSEKNYLKVKWLFNVEHSTEHYCYFLYKMENDKK